MDRTQKAQAVGSIKAAWTDVQSIVLAEYRGLDVPTITTVRDQFRKAGCHYKVLKNTLVRIAIQGSRMEPISKLLEGPTAIIWSNDSPSTPAKVASKIAREHDKFVIKGGYFDGQALDAVGVKSLATMPGKDELRAQFLMTLLAAPTEFVRLLAAGPTNFLYVLQARAEAVAALGGESK
jgi:large subunit ribosomal protein L10